MSSNEAECGTTFSGSTSRCIVARRYPNVLFKSEAIISAYLKEKSITGVPDVNRYLNDA